MNTISTPILNLAATAEMASALESAYERGLCPRLTDDFDPSIALRFWRDADGALYATAPEIVEPAATPVTVEYERGAGWRVAD